jgi:hypothetical protein
VAAVDGCHFRMQNPGMAPPDSRAHYVLRKKCYALLATAVCDADLRFLFMDFIVTPPPATPRPGLCRSWAS